MTRCEQLGVCGKMNCIPCALARDKSKEMREKAQELARSVLSSLAKNVSA